MERRIALILSVTNTLWLPVYDPISWPQILLRLHANFFLLTTASIIPSIQENNTFFYYCVDLKNVSRDSNDLIASVWRWAPQAVLTDGLGQSHWLISQQHVSHGWGETHWWIVVDTMWMEEWPSGRELHLWHPSGVLDSRCWHTGQSHPTVSAHTPLWGHGESWHSGNCGAAAVVLGEKVQVSSGFKHSVDVMDQPHLS